MATKPHKTASVQKSAIRIQFERVNKELWMIASMFVIAGVMNYVTTGTQMLLGFYVLPTIFSAYTYGRRHATLTALASVLLVVFIVYYKSELFPMGNEIRGINVGWYNIAVWGCILIIVGYTMGTLYERYQEKISELRKTYQGLIVILRQFISKDKYTENHCYRVSIYAARIAVYLGLDDERVEDVRTAALLHDIGKVEISRELLYRATTINWDEYKGIMRHVDKGGELLQPVDSTPLGRIIPIILAHHEKYDGSGYHAAVRDKIPLEARVITLADVYDALVSDRPYRRAMSPLEAKDVIIKRSGTDFDPKVVEAFLKAFGNNEMEVPNLVL